MAVYSRIYIIYIDYAQLEEFFLNEVVKHVFFYITGSDR